MTFPARQAKFSPGFPMISSEVSENVSPCHVFGRFFPVPALISRHFARGGWSPLTLLQRINHSGTETEKTQRKALVMLTAKRVSGTNLRFLCAFSVPLCLCGSNSSTWYDLPITGPSTISLTALLTHLLTHAPSNSTSNSTPNGTICARSSRARRKPCCDSRMRHICVPGVGGFDGEWKCFDS